MHTFSFNLFLINALLHLLQVSYSSAHPKLDFMFYLLQYIFVWILYKKPAVSLSPIILEMSTFLGATWGLTGSAY